MHTARKRYAIYAYAKRQQAQIICLQETHLSQEELCKRQKKWRGTFCATTYSAFARGALVWIRPGIPFHETGRKVDIEGRYALLEGLLDGKPILIGSIYAPNIDQAPFWGVLTSTLERFSSSPWILGEGYNCSLDLALDRSYPPTKHSPARAHTCIPRLGGPPVFSGRLATYTPDHQTLLIPFDTPQLACSTGPLHVHAVYPPTHSTLRLLGQDRIGSRCAHCESYMGPTLTTDPYRAPPQGLPVRPGVPTRAIRNHSTLLCGKHRQHSS